MSFSVGHIDLIVTEEQNGNDSSEKAGVNAGGLVSLLLPGERFIVKGSQIKAFSSETSEETLCTDTAVSLTAV